MEALLRGKTTGLAILTALSVFVAVSAVAVDFTKTHLYNPTWPPHARLHGYLSIARTVLIMATIIVLVWGPVRTGIKFAWGVLSLLLLGWLAIWFIAPLVVPESGDLGAYIFAGMLTPVALFALWLVRA